jgi:hypothetical protein
MKKKKQNKTTDAKTDVKLAKVDSADVEVAKSPTYSDEEIKLFLEECGKKPNFKQADLRVALAKDADELTYKDIRVLYDKAGQLSDEERFKFRHVLTFEGLTESEAVRYTRVYPSHHKFDKYFPKKADVDERYNNHFKDN